MGEWWSVLTRLGECSECSHTGGVFSLGWGSVLSVLTRVGECSHAGGRVFSRGWVAVGAVASEVVARSSTNQVGSFSTKQSEAGLTGAVAVSAHTAHIAQL